MASYLKPWRWLLNVALAGVAPWTTGRWGIWVVDVCTLRDLRRPQHGHQDELRAKGGGCRFLGPKHHFALQNRSVRSLHKALGEMGCSGAVGGMLDSHVSAAAWGCPSSRGDDVPAAVGTPGPWHWVSMS